MRGARSGAGDAGLRVPAVVVGLANPGKSPGEGLAPLWQNFLKGHHNPRKSTPQNHFEKCKVRDQETSWAVALKWECAGYRNNWAVRRSLSSPFHRSPLPTAQKPCGPISWAHASKTGFSPHPVMVLSPGFDLRIFGNSMLVASIRHFACPNSRLNGSSWKACGGCARARA